MADKTYQLSIEGIVAIVAIVGIVVMLLPFVANGQNVAPQGTAGDAASASVDSGTGVTGAVIDASASTTPVQTAANAAQTRDTSGYQRTFGVCVNNLADAQPKFWTFSFTSQGCLTTPALDVQAKVICGNKGGSISSIGYNVPCTSLS